MKTFLQAGLLSLLFCVSVQTACATATFPLNETQTNVTCPGGSNGTINITPAGGTSPYTYLWNDGDTMQNRTNLPANTYNVTVKDNSGKTGFISVTITQPSPFIIARAITNEQCGGDSMGTIHITVNGGTPGYTYAWNNGATTSNLSGLYAEVYYVTITDAAGCQTIDSCNVTQPVGIAIVSTITAATCGAPNGSINVAVQYGNPSYNYMWSDDSTSQNRSGLASGTYGLTVTDTLGCTAAANEVVNQLPGTMTINYSTTPPSCGGGSNGSISIASVIGGAGPFSYNWSNGQTTQTISNLDVGTYSVTVTAAAGCTATTAINMVAAANLDITLHVVPLTCFGSDNGAITTTIGGGVSPYSYLWSNGSIFKDLTGVPIGTYTITVTDNRGCQDTASATVTQPALLVTITSVNDPTCAGGLTGSITTSTTGGTTPYTYWWGSGVNTQDRYNVGGGNYSITVTDAQGCTGTASTSIPDYVPMVVTSTAGTVACYGSNSGSINVSVSDGWTPYSFVWSNGDTTQNIASLSGGTYTVTVSDNHNCSVTHTVNVTQPSFPITINSTVADVVCNGGTSGSVSLAVINGATPYNYNWSNGATTASLANLKAGNYNVTVLDNAGCMAMDSFTVTQPAAIVITTTDTGVSCFGGNNGSIYVSVNGGIAPFTYAWSNGYNKQNFLNARAGSYTVTVTDSRSCTALASTSISQPSNATITSTIQNVLCFGGNNGSVNLSVTGGTPPYQYNWPGGSTGASQTNLAAGAYQVTVTDLAGCTYPSADTVHQPSAIIVLATTVNIVCNGGNTGAINLSVSGGSMPYTFNWTGGITTQNRSNIGAGTYIVTVTDHANCPTEDTSIITQISGLIVTATSNNITCNGANNGAINLNVSGGTPAYSYNWGGGIITQSRTNLSPGKYVVTITDHAGCTSMDTNIITQPATLAISDTVTNVACFAGGSGSIKIVVAGGSPSYQFKWNDGVTTQNRSGLAAGSYQLTVTDNQNCTAISGATISQPASLNISYTSAPVSCHGGGNGSISLNATGGISPYRYNWGNGITSAQRTNLVAGTYPVTLTDANNCTVDTGITITQPNPLALLLTDTNMRCFGQPNGSINLNVTGGTPAYQFNWGNNLTSQNRSNLPMGNYTVTVTDAHSCTATASDSISQPTQITTTIFSIVNANCYGAQNGSIDITVAGGTPSYTFVWSNNTQSQNLSGVGAGNYTVTITDANNCTSASTINLTEPPAITIASSPTAVSCFGGDNGALSVLASGGNGGFNYKWSDNQTGDSIAGLSSAQYVVTATDVMHCSASFSLSVSQPAALVVTATPVNVSCNGGANGSINLSALGGNAPYNYNWGAGITGQSRNNLTPGNYAVTVSDTKGCTATDSSSVNQPASISINISETSYACPATGGSIQISVAGGTAPYHYLWSDGSANQNRTGINPGNYTVTVTDAKSCIDTAATTIRQIPSLQISLSETDVSCFGGTNGSMTVATTGGTTPFRYNWSNQSEGKKIDSLVAATYSITVSDSNHCSASAADTIRQPAQIQIQNTIHSPACAGANNGSVQINATGGTAPYTYLWNNNDTTGGISNIAAGTYAITVTDAHSCKASLTTIQVNQPSPVELQAEATGGNCANHNESNVDLQISGGTSPYNFNWSNSSTNQNLNSVATGNYTVTVTDAHSCTAVTSVSVTVTPGVELSSTVNNTACSSVQTGSISLSVSGGKPDYHFNWSNGETRSELSNLAAGDYAVTVSDANSCTASSDFTIGTNYNLQVSISGQNTVVNGQPVQLNAEANVDHSNVYSWSPSAYLTCGNCNVTEAQPAETTLFTVSVTDMNGCTAIDTITIDVDSRTSIFIPNAFSPNNDGNNDVFHVYGELSGIRYFELVVFDRWGEKVYETNDYASGWDGEFRGQPAPVATYVYVATVTFADGTDKNYKGSVNLFR